MLHECGQDSETREHWICLVHGPVRNVRALLVYLLRRKDTFGCSLFIVQAREILTKNLQFSFEARNCCAAT